MFESALFLPTRPLTSVFAGAYLSVTYADLSYLSRLRDVRERDRSESSCATTYLQVMSVFARDRIRRFESCRVHSAFLQFRGHFKLLGAPWAPDVNDPAGRDLLADVAAIGPGWGCIIVRIERQPGAGDGGRPSE